MPSVQRHVPIVSATVALSLMAFGCGGSDETSTQDVVDAFKDKTGVLVPRSSSLSNDDWDVVSSPDDDSGGADGTYDELGAFTVYVVKHDVDENVDSLLSRSTDNSEMKVKAYVPADDQGIIWEQTCFDITGDCTWFAKKQYGDNIVVQWLAGKRRGTTGSWDRLDTILSGVGN